MQLCIGAGRTGVTEGANGDTYDILIAGYRGAGALNIVSFSPFSITESFTGCNMPLFDIGSLVGSPPFDSESNLYFAFDAFTPGCSNGYACRFSTISCGNIHQDCYTITITYDAMPDSIRVFGVEGAGNPVDGCTPDPDMLIEFTTLPVRWVSTEAAFIGGKGVQLDWSFVSQEGNGGFEIQKMGNVMGGWEKVGELQAEITAGVASSNTFLDVSPPLGLAQYRIRYVSPSGETSTSVVLSVNVTSGSPTVSPNPFQENLSIQTGLQETVNGQLDILGIDGRTVYQYVGSLTPIQHFELGHLPDGVYFARLQTPAGTTQHRIMKR